MTFRTKVFQSLYASLLVATSGLGLGLVQPTNVAASVRRGRRDEVPVAQYLPAFYDAVDELQLKVSSLFPDEEEVVSETEEYGLGDDSFIAPLLTSTAQHLSQ